MIELFESLQDRSVLSSKTVTITGNPGATLPPWVLDIALDKNWSVTGAEEGELVFGESGNSLNFDGSGTDTFVFTPL